MTTQPQFAAVLDALPAEQIDGEKGFYSAGSVRSVAWVRPFVVCESPMPESLVLMNRANLAADFWREVVALNPLFDCEKESVVAVFLDRRNRVKGWNLVSLGTATACIAHPREILRGCLVAGACAFILMHNHPSGDPSPSLPDLQFTRAIREAARAVDIDFADHVIVGRAGADPLGRGFYSFREGGHL